MTHLFFREHQRGLHRRLHVPGGATGRPASLLPRSGSPAPTAVDQRMPQLGVPRRLVGLQLAPYMPKRWVIEPQRPAALVRVPLKTRCTCG
jgi:hypothetical protein